MKLRHTTINDLPEVIEIINQAKLYFKNEGIDQWQDGYPNEDSIINEPIDTFDYVRVLSVLLDNAIEEAEEYSNGAMNVYFIKDSSNNLTVIVENTFYGKYSNISELFQTSMSSKGHNRGLGLASVEIILNKYRNISLETEIKNDLFIQKIIMKW